jgi:hypothetical protein
VIPAKSTAAWPALVNQSLNAASCRLSQLGGTGPPVATDWQQGSEQPEEYEGGAGNLDIFLAQASEAVAELLQATGQQAPHHQVQPNEGVPPPAAAAVGGEEEALVAADSAAAVVAVAASHDAPPAPCAARRAALPVSPLLAEMCRQRGNAPRPAAPSGGPFAAAAFSGRQHSLAPATSSHQPAALATISEALPHFAEDSPSPGPDPCTFPFNNPEEPVNMEEVQADM